MHDVKGIGYRPVGYEATRLFALAGLQAVQIVTLSPKAVYLTGKGKWNARTVYLVRQAMYLCCTEKAMYLGCRR